MAEAEKSEGEKPEDEKAEELKAKPEGEKPEGEKKAEGEKAEGETEKKQPWAIARIDKLTREKGDLARRNAVLEEMVAGMTVKGEKPKAEDQPKTDAKPFTQAEIDAEVNRRAAELANTNDFNKSCNTVYSEGKAKHEDFDKVLGNFSSLGGLAIDTTQMILETDNPAEVFYALGKDLDEAQRIFDLPPLKRAAALIKFGAKLAAPAAPKKISEAPDPIKPPRTGNGKGDVDLYSDDVPVDQWMKQRNKELSQKRA